MTGADAVLEMKSVIHSRNYSAKSQHSRVKHSRFRLSTRPFGNTVIFLIKIFNNFFRRKLVFLFVCVARLTDARERALSVSRTANGNVNGTAFANGAL